MADLPKGRAPRRSVALTRRLLIVGAGGHGRSVAEAALESGAYEVVGFLDDAFPGLGSVWEIPVLGKVADYSAFRLDVDCCLVAIGNNVVREKTGTLLKAGGFELASVIHPRALVSPRAVIGAGSAVMMGAVVGTEARLSEGAIVNCGAVVDHHCVVEDYGHLGVGAVMAGGSVLGRGAWMQANAALGYGMKIEAGRVLAPGEALGGC